MNLQDCCLVMDDEAFLCCWSHKESWSPTFLCRVVKGLNFVWVFSRPKQPEGEGKEKEGRHSEDALQNSEESVSTSYLRLIIGELRTVSDVGVVDGGHFEEVSVWRR